jgi:hypothetical protein
MSASVPSWARVGAKVVCVDDRPGDGTRWVEGEELVRHRLYTIAAVLPHLAQVQLQEVERASISKRIFGYNGYGVDRFRPLITRSQSEDVAEFRKLLDQIPVGA